MKPRTPYLYIKSNEQRSMGYDRWLPSVNEFTPHPLNEKVYGSPKVDEKLIESIEKVGVLQPIIVNRNKQIVSGHRRWQACKINSGTSARQGLPHPCDNVRRQRFPSRTTPH